MGIPGAVLHTGYLDGAVATQLRAGDPLFSHVQVPVCLGGMHWTGLFLRDERVLMLLPS